MRMKGEYIWTDKEVVSWAHEYIQNNETLFTVEERLGVSHSTLWWCFCHRLFGIDSALYHEVMNKVGINKRKRGPRRKEIV